MNREREKGGMLDQVEVASAKMVGGWDYVHTQEHSWLLKLALNC